MRDDPAPIVVGLSGGSDSVALLHLTCAWARGAGRPVLALTVDHRLNPQSAAWTALAGEVAAQAGADFRPLAWDGAKPERGLPAAARAARHALLAAAAREAGAAVVLLGHTTDDGDETERMRAGDAPGIGRLREWAPSPAWPQGKGVFLLRPLLSLRRARLRAWLSTIGAIWIEDPANEDTRYARVRARHSAAPHPPRATADDGAVAALAARGRPVHGGGIRLPRAALLAADRAVARRVLSAAVVCAAGGSRPPRSHALDRLLGGIEDLAPAATLAGARVVPSRDYVSIAREPGEARRRSPFPLDGGRAGNGGGGGRVGVASGRRLPRLHAERSASIPSPGLSPIEGERSALAAAAYRRFQAATFQIVDEAQLRTTSSP